MVKSTIYVNKRGNRSIVKKAEIVVDRRLKHRGLRDILEIAVKHELREHLHVQNRPVHDRKSHKYALRGERKDVKKKGFTIRQYNRIVGMLGYKPDL